MNKHHTTIGLLGGAALSLAAGRAHSVPSSTSASAAPVAASPSASAPVEAPMAALAPFHEGLPSETSPKPTAKEWAAAPELEPTRRGPRGATCHVFRVREWVRVSCPELVTASISMLGGTTQGMAFWIDPQKTGADGKLPSGGEVLFPVRAGDRRVVQFLTFGPGYEGPLTQLPALVVQEHWLEGAPHPTLTLL